MVKYIFSLFIAVICSCQVQAAYRGELRIATYIEEPFSYIKNNELVGENIEIAKLLAKSINLDPIFIHCPFARCLSMVKHGQADMIFGLRKFPEREIHLTFLSPAYMIQHYPLRFFTLKSSHQTITKFDDLTKLTVGILRGATYFDQFDHNNTIKKVALTSRVQLVNMLLKGRIDTFLEREESIKPLVSQNDYKNKFELENYQYDRASASYIAISKHSKIQSYSKKLSDNLAQLIQDGSLKKVMIDRSNPLKSNENTNKNTNKNKDN